MIIVYASIVLMELTYNVHNYIRTLQKGDCALLYICAREIMELLNKALLYCCTGIFPQLVVSYCLVNLCGLY